MKLFKLLQSGRVAGSLALALAFLSATTTARANVYATDIQVNGNLTNANVAPGSPVSITYRLNQTADRGVTVNILQGNTVVKTITGGTNMGLNSVSWTSVAAGTYSVSITAAATGFPIWTQISIDTNAGMPAYAPQGIDVDKNANSPYYGRVIMGCSYSDTGNHNPFVPAFARKDGLYKMNADGTYADEGGYGDAGYTEDNNGDPPTAGQMPDSFGLNPYIIRIGDDDRIYWCDNTVIGAIVACDMQATTNQSVIVLNNGNYASNLDLSYLVNDGGNGIQQFDVTGTTTTNPAVWLADSDDSPNWGIWMFHMVGGAADPKDNEGTQAVSAGSSSDLYEASGGCMIDTNLDIFVSSGPTSAAVGVLQTMLYSKWRGGVLPPENSGESFTYGKTSGQVSWGDQVASYTDFSWEAIQDTVINNRTNPTMAALPMAKGDNNGNGGGIKVIKVANGAVVTVTNGSGAVIQSLTNIDWGNAYTCAAWDNVGNLYAASTTTNCWRVWSPPGTNQATTLAVATVQVLTPPDITGIALNGTTVTIDFTGGTNDPASAFTLISSGTVVPLNAYASVTNATITKVGSGVFQATATVNGSTRFYRLER
jgi:hypothetical protein